MNPEDGATKIVVFLGTVLTLVLIIGSMMYLIEGEERGFTVSRRVSTGPVRCRCTILHVLCVAIVRGVDEVSRYADNTSVYGAPWST